MTEDVIGVGVAGFWHVHADDYARETEAHPGTRVAAAWDDEPGRAREGAARWGVERAESLDALLAHPRVDAITVTTATADHTGVIGRAIEAGKHVFTEKLLAPTVAESQRLADAAAAKGVALVVSLPQLTNPVMVAAADLVDRGTLGAVTYARVRMAHDGWLTGSLPDRFADPVAAIGGAFTDLGCHPAYLVQRLLGAYPERVSAVYTRVTGREVEDNAVVVAAYPDGALGVAEASFVTTPGALAMEVRGTEASLLHGFGRGGLHAKGGPFGDEWVPVPLRPPPPTPFELWVDAIRGRADASANVSAAIDLTRFIVAANTAAAANPRAGFDPEGPS
ncbi:Gfo/Idh/MocA family oxidoreductase [Microbacterium sp. dk485]|uniref:Gfo/Idh/MocA family protein n=1 Tax=Microbacterium sp. dk485 TaxID=2560021 RepID=UPI0010733330|nr:Gfo/Idh/MocA family oxidoreductase [Microbacterium sp. dk485]TFV84440.1 Gfo/Idh/MocA family oxidoreductase [Microbacterium sp. dk485]